MKYNLGLVSLQVVIRDITVNIKVACGPSWFFYTAVLKLAHVLYKKKPILGCFLAQHDLVFKAWSQNCWGLTLFPIAQAS